MNIVGLVPCAGKGNRLGLPFSKELYPDVYNETYRPIIIYTIEAMKRAGINHIIFTVNPTKIELLKYLGNGKQFGMDFTFVIHPEAKSLPESLNEAYHLLKDVHVVFAMPDTVIQPNDFLKKMIKCHLTEDSNEVTLGCFKTNKPQKFGMVDMIGNQVVRIDDKPKHSSLKWMWGAMIWNPSFTGELNNFVIRNNNRENTETELKLSDSLQNLIISNKVGVLKFPQGKYRDLGTYDEIIEWAKAREIPILV